MNKIELNHWFLKENEISISLMRFHARINILKNNQFIYFQTIINGEDNELTFNFYSIEDAMSVVEQVVAKSKNTNEIIEKYILMFEKEKYEKTLSKKVRKLK